MMLLSQALSKPKLFVPKGVRARANFELQKDLLAPGVVNTLKNYFFTDTSGESLKNFLINDLVSSKPRVLKNLRAYLDTLGSKEAVSLRMEGPFGLGIVQLVAAAAAALISNVIIPLFSKPCAEPPCYPRPGGDGFYSCTQDHDIRNVNDIRSGNMSSGSFLVRVIGYIATGMDVGEFNGKPIPGAPFPRTEYAELNKDQKLANLEYFQYIYNTPGSVLASSGPCPNYADAASEWLNANVEKIKAASPPSFSALRMAEQRLLLLQEETTSDITKAAIFGAAGGLVVVGVLGFFLLRKRR